jgi:hypothetical protein
LALNTHTNFRCAASFATLDKLVDRFPLPPGAPPIGDTSLTHVIKLAAHSTKPATPTTMVQHFIVTPYLIQFLWSSTKINIALLWHYLALLKCLINCCVDCSFCIVLSIKYRMKSYSPKKKTLLLFLEKNRDKIGSNNQKIKKEEPEVIKILVSVTYFFFFFKFKLFLINLILFSFVVFFFEIEIK